jgi:hypothetical protein
MFTAVLRLGDIYPVPDRECVGCMNLQRKLGMFLSLRSPIVR